MNNLRTRWLLGLAVLAAAGPLLWRRLERRAPPVLRFPPEAAASSGSEALQRVAALGRLEPRGGVIRVAGPPQPAVVIDELRMEEGDRVEKGQIIAILAGIGLHRAEVARLQAELQQAERELERNRKLLRDNVLSASQWEALQLERDVARARLRYAEADLELSRVRSPIDGQVLEVHAREGERVGPGGIAQLGETGAMYAVAEVYETDIGRVRVGQRARIRSPALPHEIEGEVERVGLEIGKKDVLSTDPVVDADARVVEVEIRLLEPELVAALTNLRVDVLIEP
jgi:RND family efflux transporter MFP subunit